MITDEEINKLVSDKVAIEVIEAVRLQEEINVAYRFFSDNVNVSCSLRDRREMNNKMNLDPKSAVGGLLAWYELYLNEKREADKK